MTQHTLVNKVQPQGPTGIKVAPNGVVARVILAFLTTAGIFYINIMPAVLSGLKDGLGFTNQQAGFVSSANLYGAAVGALLAVLMIKKINWRLWAYNLLVALIIIDLACIFIQTPQLMISVRALHGVTGGLLVGIGFAIISRTLDADKTFGYLLFIQWGLGGLGLMYLPGLVPEYGTSVLFIALLCFTSVTLIMLPFLPDYSLAKRVDKEGGGKEGESKAAVKVKALPLTLNLFGIFLFQAANMGLFAYMIALGRAEGLTIDFMSPALGLASWVALLGALLVIVIGTKYGRALPLLISIVITAVCSWALHFSEASQVYLYANIVIGVCWAFVLPYLFGICAELDRAGQLAALGGFASKMGLASGPMVGALMLGGDNYDQVIDIAAIVLIVCAVVVFKPARLLDRK